jgi:hypothetical protein
MPSEVDPVSGQIHGPSPLVQPEFEQSLQAIEQVFATKARYGGLSYADQEKVSAAIEYMFDELKGQVRVMPPADYVACRNFLQSLSYAASKTLLQ